jgi:hypothetical protein
MINLYEAAGVEAGNPSTSSDDGTDDTDASSLISTPPPTFADIDRWNFHTDLKKFGEELQSAANAVFPNEKRSRYSKVSVLMLSWSDEDPHLPVSHEISKLHGVFQNIYGFETDQWAIPDVNSHYMVTQKIMDFVKPTDKSKSHLKIVYYAGHAKLMSTRVLAWTRYV